MSTALKRASLWFAASVVCLSIAAAAAPAADPVDPAFGQGGVAEIEARAAGQSGGIADLERGREGSLLAAVHPFARRRSHFFAVAKIRRNGALDPGFGEGGFTQSVPVGRPHEENGQGVLQSEAVAEADDGSIVLAGYLEHEGVFAPALARFRPDGELDPSFGRRGRVVLPPRGSGKGLRFGETGGLRLHDVAIGPGGDIFGAGGVVPGRLFAPERPRRKAAVVVAYLPDGKVDRSFGDGGRFEVRPPRGGGFTSFSEIEALPSGKLLVSGYVGRRLAILRLTAAGRRDASFGGGDGEVTIGGRDGEAGGYPPVPFAVDGSGRIVLGGVVFSASILNGESVVLVRLLPDGRRDPTFRHSIYIERAPADRDEPIPRAHVEYYAFAIEGIALDGHGRIVTVGSELAPYHRGQKEAGYEYFAARRFLADGRRDRSFGHGGSWATNPPGSRSRGAAAVTAGDGTVVAGGQIEIERYSGKRPGNTAMLLTRYR